MCSFGTFFSPESGVCDTVSKGLCDQGNVSIQIPNIYPIDLLTLNCMYIIFLEFWYLYSDGHTKFHFYIWHGRHFIHSNSWHLLTDPCLQNQRDYTYPSNFNCRSFYQCSKNGRSVPMCCRDFYRFDFQLQECTPDASCNISCNRREGQINYQLSADELMKTDPFGNEMYLFCTTVRFVFVFFLHYLQVCHFSFNIF